MLEIRNGVSESQLLMKKLLWMCGKPVCKEEYATF
jgi:hypothetical protein